MRRRNDHLVYPALSWKDSLLSIPGYTFDKTFPWHDTGSLTWLAEGCSLKDGSNVLAKVARTQSNACMCLDREDHILTRMGASADGYSTALRVIDFVQIPPENGDAVVLVVIHPGPNLLGRYLPATKINDLLLADMSRLPSTPLQTDVSMKSDDDPEWGAGDFDIMDLASFLEFAIPATRCLESLHKIGFIHREVRANAFHLNSHSGAVRLVHFGNRAISLENFGSPSSLVIQTDEEEEKLKVKEALCYLAPEQTGGIETMTQDHRTDLYSLGILFWTLLVGGGQMPFEGETLELLHAIVQKRPMPVHEVRRDIPQVLAEIVEKLLAKSPDARYQSAHGLQSDLIQCRCKLLAAISSTADEPFELIPHFEIAVEDRFMEFTMPLALFGREKELELIRSVIRSTSTSFSFHFLSSKTMTGPPANKSPHSTNKSIGMYEDQSESAFGNASLGSPGGPFGRASMLSPGIGTVNYGFRKAVLHTNTRVSRTQAIVVIGAPGVGKSSMILVNQARWRSHGLWGQAKFQSADSAPFAALLSCLSSVLRQLMVFPTDLHRFTETLKERLGPQIQNMNLLYQGAPDLKEVLEKVNVKFEGPREYLSTCELRARFQSLVENIFAVIAETRLFALFLDDLHEADESTLDLVSTLLNSRSRMLIFATLRSDRAEVMERVKAMFVNRPPPTWIWLEPLPFPAISSLVSRTLRRSKEECTPLSRFVFSASSGNAFSARNILLTMNRQNHIKFSWDDNHWKFNIIAIERGYTDRNPSDPADLSSLRAHLQDLPEEAKGYLIWAVFFGETFKIMEVAMMMDWEYSGGDNEESDDILHLRKVVSDLQKPSMATSRASMRGLQIALSEGWLIQRARDMCSFAHDRYRQAAQAEAEAMPGGYIAKMSLRIVLMMLHENPKDIHRIAEHANRCLSMLEEHPKKEEILHVLVDAGESAWDRGAHEMAIKSFANARTLFGKDPWIRNHDRTFRLLAKIAALQAWQGDYDGSDLLARECYEHAKVPEERALLLQIRAQNYWRRHNFREALIDTLAALGALEIEVKSSPSRREAVAMFEVVQNEIMVVGFDEILSIPRTADLRTELAVALLNDAGINAYWTMTTSSFADVVGLMTIRLALRSGITPGTALGFFWALGVVSERRELYRLSTDMGRMALRIAEKYGGNREKCRALVLFCATVSGYDSVHIRTTLPRLAEAIRYGECAGDRLFQSLASVHAVLTRLYVCEHLDDVSVTAEECLNDVKRWDQGKDLVMLATAIFNCIRVLNGQNDSLSGQAGKNFLEYGNISNGSPDVEVSALSSLTLNWCNSLELVTRFCTGQVEEAARLGFSVFKSRLSPPNHRHIRYALFFHSLAMIACLRNGIVPSEEYNTYLLQIGENQAFLRKWVSASTVNNSMWVALVEAETAALVGSPDAHKLYDIAVKLAADNDWLLEEGWALFLQGSHFVRCGVENLGNELQKRGIARHSQWGARGIVNHLKSVLGIRSECTQKRPLLYSDATVQTESVAITVSQTVQTLDHEKTEDDQESTLSASDLASILKWSKEISRDINLSSALQRLTEIATENAKSQITSVVIAREAGDYIVATSMFSPGPCHVHENPKPIRTIADPLQKAIIEHALNSKERVCYDDASLDSRFSSEAGQTIHRSVICLPIFSNRGQTFGAVYVSSNQSFPQNTVTMLTLLCQQASTSIANALLFRSVQNGTKENLKMIAAQKEALEEARQSREDALKATKTKSNFLASMSHELRTPFSSFYGLLDLLSGTDLNPGQSDIVQTAKQSCELLLRIIDSILDYSKLEALAVKLETSGFLVENIIADCMELLLPTAVKKLDLSFNIEPDVPPWVVADYARIRQVLMNLIGNAVKFTAHGFVRVTCSRIHSPNPKDPSPRSPTNPDEIYLKFDIEDTGIGLSSTDVDHLFIPFQQVDNSSTRRFGGTGLGLSISRQLVKLLGGVVGVESKVDSGSLFWFTITANIYRDPEVEQSCAAIAQLKSVLMAPQPLEIIVCSPSKTTLAFLNTMFSGFRVTLTSTLLDTEVHLQTTTSLLDFIILDDQSESHVENLYTFIHGLDSPALRSTKLVHLYTPTASVAGHAVFSTTTPGIVKMTKPPRMARMLQMLARLRDLPNTVTLPTNQTTDIPKTVEEGVAQRSLWGNILIAEDNPIAQHLLITQLERFNLNVTAASNGEQALEFWEAQEPGFFSVALFDHHMPICDGVEATKRLRLLENKRKSSVTLPIVALSADCQESTKKLCLSAGMNAFFTKPLKKADLAALLNMFGATGT